jgi:hypothetical protein
VFQQNAQQPVDDCLQVLGSCMLAGNTLPPVIASIAVYRTDAVDATKDDVVRSHTRLSVPDSWCVLEWLGTPRKKGQLQYPTGWLQSLRCRPCIHSEDGQGNLVMCA